MRIAECSLAYGRGTTPLVPVAGGVSAPVRMDTAIQSRVHKYVCVPAHVQWSGAVTVIPAYPFF